MANFQSSKAAVVERLQRAIRGAQGLPGIMASPPTRTAGSGGGAPTLPSYYPNTAPQFKFLGSRSGAYVNTYNVVDNCRPTVGATAGGTAWRIAFMTDADKFELKIQSAGGEARYSVLVDGEYTADPFAAYYTRAAGGTNYHDVFDFGSFAPEGRLIVLEMNASYRFAGVYVPQDCRIWEPKFPRTRMVMFGDSFVEGSNSTNGYTGLPLLLGKLLGIDDVWGSGVGATGFLATAGGTKVKWRDRAQADIIDLAPDLLVIPGSTNDAGSSAADIGTEADALFAMIRAALPNTVIVATGTLNMHGTNATYEAQMAEIFQAVNANAWSNGEGVLTIDNLTAGVGQWTSGTGNVGATSGAGNADRYCATDNAHPSPGALGGHPYLAARFAEAIGDYVLNL